MTLARNGQIDGNHANDRMVRSLVGENTAASDTGPTPIIKSRKTSIPHSLTALA